MTQKIMLYVSFMIGLSGTVFGAGNLKLPSIFSDNMIVQNGVKCPIWGSAQSGATIKVSVFNQEYSTIADSNGCWRTYVPPVTTADTFIIKVIDGQNCVSIKNVIAGDVWFCSGQSNMGVRVAESANAEAEIASANYPKIRLFVVPVVSSDHVQTDVNGFWQECSPKTIRNFSGVGYFFGRYLHEQLKTPIGLIRCACGGTPVESWTRRDLLETDSDNEFIFQRWQQWQKDLKTNQQIYNEKLADWNDKVRIAESLNQPLPPKPIEPVEIRPSWRPGGLYTAMVRPLMPFAIKGVIWYQGESNADRAFQYRKLFPLMIRNWREDWKQGDFPFLYVQIANFGNIATQPDESAWAELREAQLRTLAVPNTGMAVTIDIGDPCNIHPVNKQEVGRRLGLIALNKVYGRPVICSGPVYKSMSVEDNKIRLFFDHTGSGLAAHGQQLQGFAIADCNQKFVWAKAAIDGNTVVVSSDKCEFPIAVRYAFSQSPTGNLYNREGLPATPFRTDSFRAITFDKK